MCVNGHWSVPCAQLDNPTPMAIKGLMGLTELQEKTKKMENDMKLVGKGHARKMSGEEME